MRKRIAVLVAQVDETTQNRFLTAFMKEAYAHDYDVFIFTMYQKYQETWLRDIGDSNIYNLIDFRMFDAVLIMIDTILTKGLEEPLQKRVKEEFDGPVLVVDKASPFFDSVMMDHYTPFRKIVDHLIDVHGYREIAFLGGKEGHPHSVQRFNGFLDSMKAHNLPIREEWIFHGNYWYDSAEEFVDQLLMDRDHLPRAIACANDCMAIGAAARLTENGVRVPEDVAISGYDSIAEGKDSPEPLTSADIPADECGTYCLEWLDAKLRGKSVPVFSPKAPIFIGSSCGCEHKKEYVPREQRAVWRTRQSSRGVFSDFNHILEDLLSHSDIETFLRTIQDYSYQIQPFYSFDICLNENFMNPEMNVGQKAIRHGYSKNMYHVLALGEGRRAFTDIQLNRAFQSADLLPMTDEYRAYPTTYIFNPIYFEDRCFGYSILNQGTNISLYTRGYRIWMRNIMQGMEAFYRLQYMQSLVKKIQSDQVRDGLTGLYNYEGFIAQTEQLHETLAEGSLPIHIIAVDMKGLKSINELYGRQFGDRCLKSVSRALLEVMQDDEIAARMCNDEFLICCLDSAEHVRCQEIVEKLRERLKSNPMMTDSEYVLDFFYAYVSSAEAQQDSLEGLINHTINIKNHVKRKQSRTGVAGGSVENEIIQNQMVERILNLNRLTYHYQPIVSAYDGTIYAYEALMRDCEGKLSPFQIIQSANYLKRLDDVERATLLNVTKDVEENIKSFGDCKVFINSIPGTTVSDAEDAEITERIRRDSGRYVIEFTEENEMEEEKLMNLKTKLQGIGARIAIDDFGVGYSNVRNLLRYMPQFVKIDRQLITGIQDNPQKQHFVKSIIDFSHENNIEVLAEGVETSLELKECIYLGVDLIQGYYTARPRREVIVEIAPDLRNEIRRLQFQSSEWRTCVV